MSEIVLEVHERQAANKNANRRLRASGHVPAVVYGSKLDPAPIQVEERKMRDLLRSQKGGNIVFLLKLHGTEQSRHVMIRELQTDSISGEMIHIDFQRILMDQKVRVQVQIELEGEPVGVKTEGGLVDFVTREVELECLPNNIPSQITVDISELHVGQHLEAKDLELPKDVELHDPDRVIVSISQPQKAEAEETEEDELLESEAAEPEVVQRGKTEDE